MQDKTDTSRLSLTKMRQKKEEINNYSSSSGKTYTSSRVGKGIFNFFQKSKGSLDKKLDDLIRKKNIEESTEINIKEYLEIAYHYKFLILLILLTVVLAIFAYTKRQRDIYKASTKIFIQQDLMELQIINNKPMFKQDLDIKTWLQIIKSSEIAKRASKILEGRVSPSQISAMIECKTERDEEHIVNIIATSTNRVETAEVANAMYLALKEYDTEVRSTGFNNSLDYIKSQLKTKQDELDKLDEQIENFYHAHNINKYTDDVEINLQNVNKFREMLSTAEVELSAVKANINSIKEKLKSEETDIVAQTTYSEPLKIRLMNLEVDLARALTKYTEKHPKVQAIKNNIENVKRLIQEGAEKNIQLKNLSANPIRQQLVNDLIEREGESISLEQKINALKKLISSYDILPEYRTELNKLQRQKNALENVLVNLQSQLNEIKLNANIKVSRIYQLQEPVVPSSPANSGKMKMNLMIAIVVGLGLGYACAFLIYKMDNRIKSIEDFTKRYNIPLIGTIPLLKFNPLQVAIADEGKEQDKLVLSDIFKRINLNFKYLILDKNHKAFAIASAGREEGKSNVALNMAESLAQDRLKVILVDTDFYVPRLSKMFKKQDDTGLSEVLSGQAKLEDCIHETEIANLSFLTTGKKPPSVSRMLNSENCLNLIKKLKQQYDIVLFDTPAVLPITESSYIFSNLDGVILICKILQTTHNDVKKVIKRIITTNTEIFGAILNYSRHNIFDKEYEDYSDYYYKYRYKYGYGYYDTYKGKEGFNFWNDVIRKPANKVYNYILSSLFITYPRHNHKEEQEEDKNIEEIKKQEIESFGKWADRFKE